MLWCLSVLVSLLTVIIIFIGYLFSTFSIKVHTQTIKQDYCTEENISGLKEPWSPPLNLSNKRIKGNVNILVFLNGLLLRGGEDFRVGVSPSRGDLKYFIKIKYGSCITAVTWGRMATKKETDRAEKESSVRYVMEQ